MKAKNLSVLAGLLVLLVIVFLLNGCIVTKNSPAPGCVRYLGPAPMGGCFGKQIIRDIHLEPAEACLTITANNCNGGVLEMNNHCNQPVMLGGTTMVADQHVSLDVRRDGKGYHLMRAGGNISEYLPQADEHIMVTGSLGNTPLHLEFVKTEPLCP